MLFGTKDNNEIKNQIELNLYCDEIKNVHINDNIFGNEKWAYIGILIVPTNLKNDLLNNLLNYRCGNPNEKKEWGNCSPLCRYHENNNKEVHYNSLDSKNEYYISDRWLDFFLQDKSQTYFYIFGIDLFKIDYSLFGFSKGNEKFNTIYNRLFRIAITKSVKYFFSEYKKITIKEIFHDNSDLIEHYYFPWHCIYKLDQTDDKLFFICNKISFIESDHKKSSDLRSNFIQYIDLLLGLSFNALHYASDNENKVKLTQKYLPLIERLMNYPNNKNSHFKYYKRQSIDFFPKYKISSLTEAEKEIYKYDSFYKKRELRIKRKTHKTLFD